MLPRSLGAVALPLSAVPSGSWLLWAGLSGFSHQAEKFYIKHWYWRSIHSLLNPAFRSRPSSCRSSSWKEGFGKEKGVWEGWGGAFKRSSLCPAWLTEILCNTLQVALNKTPPSSLPQIEIEATELRSGIAYVARVRCKVSENEDSYHSQWSEWSQTTVFQRAGTKNVVFTLIHVFMTMFKKKKRKISGKMMLFRSDLASFKFSQPSVSLRSLAAYFISTAWLFGVLSWLPDLLIIIFVLILFLGVPKLSEKIPNSRTMQFLFIPLSFGALLYLFWNCKLSSRYVIAFH